MPKLGIQVCEIFRSLQGEGLRQGAPCTFIRMVGCNLNCRWCDTPYSRNGGCFLDHDAILSKVRAKGEDYICMTGGEPLVQSESLLPLTTDLAAAGYHIDIETNGTLDFSPFQESAAICMDVKCPSSGETSDLRLLSCLSPRDSVKFVVGDEEDCRYAASILHTHPPDCPVFFSPVWGTDPRRVAEFILEEHLPVRLQLQIHKILGVR